MQCFDKVQKYSVFWLCEVKEVVMKIVMPYDGLFNFLGHEYRLRRFRAMLVFLGLVLTEKSLLRKYVVFTLIEYKTLYQRVLCKFLS